MIPTIHYLNETLYLPSKLVIANFETEKEGMVYQACQFTLSGAKVICRTAKITPKKVGQFVTFWNRNSEGVTQPFSNKDDFIFM